MVILTSSSPSFSQYSQQKDETAKPRNLYPSELKCLISPVLFPSVYPSTNWNSTPLYASKQRLLHSTKLKTKPRYNGPSVRPTKYCLTLVHRFHLHRPWGVAPDCLPCLPPSTPSRMSQSAYCHSYQHAMLDTTRPCLNPTSIQALNTANLNYLVYLRQFGEVRDPLQSPKPTQSLPINTRASLWLAQTEWLPHFTVPLACTTNDFTSFPPFPSCSQREVGINRDRGQLPLAISIGLSVCLHVTKKTSN
jgi:hypothetical protein